MKLNVSTSLDEEIIKRLEFLAERDVTSQAALLRKCVLRALPTLEREILGSEFVGSPVNGEKEVALK